jgi:hypothetical protein
LVQEVGAIYTAWAILSRPLLPVKLFWKFVSGISLFKAVDERRLPRIASTGPGGGITPLPPGLRKLALELLGDDLPVAALTTVTG